MLSPIPVFTSFLGIAYLLRPVLAHCKIVTAAASLSQPGPRSHGFMVNLNGKYPWHIGQPGDAGGDAPFFTRAIEYVPNPKFPCGELATLPKGIDIQSSLAQAEASGVATTAADGSFQTIIYQVNRDGGGGCKCEYDTTATAKTWQACKTLVNPPGIQGMWQSDRTNHTAIFQLPPSTICKGGMFKDKCIVRIRCGYKLRFGGCIALKTPASSPPLRLNVAGGGSSRANEIISMAAKIYNSMTAKGAIVPVPKGKKPPQKSTNKPRAPAEQSSASLAAASSIDAVALQVIKMIRSNNMRVVKQKAQTVAQSLTSGRGSV